MVLTRDYLLWSPLASIVALRGPLRLQQLFLKKVPRNDGIPFLTDLGLQGHQTCMACSLDLYPQYAPYGTVQRIQVWGTWEVKWSNSGASTLPNLIHTSLGGLGLVSGAL